MSNDVTVDSNIPETLTLIYASLALNVVEAAEAMKLVYVEALSGPAGGDADQIGVVSGELVGSVEVEYDMDPQGPGAWVGITDPEQHMILVRNIEGFHGTDSAGRTYNEAGKEAISAVWTLVQPVLVDIMGKSLALLGD